MPTPKKKTIAWKADKAIGKYSGTQVENIMTDDVPMPIPPSLPVSRKRASKPQKGFVNTVKDDVRSVIKAVGRFARKNAPEVPPPQKRKGKDIVPPFEPPI